MTIQRHNVGTMPRAPVHPKNLISILFETTYLRFAYLAFLALCAYCRISDLSVFNAETRFESAFSAKSNVNKLDSLERLRKKGNA